MEKTLEILLNSIKQTMVTVQYIVENHDRNGVLLASLIETLKAQELLVKSISKHLRKNN